MVNISSGELIRLVRERGRGADCAAAIDALGQVRPGIPKLLVWDNAPAHHTHVARDAAGLAQIELAWLPFRSPELNPCEDLWRHLKATVAANRAYDSVEVLAERAAAWLDDLEPDRVLQLAGLQSRKFDWLST